MYFTDTLATIITDTDGTVIYRYVIAINTATIPWFSELSLQYGFSCFFLYGTASSQLAMAITDSTDSSYGIILRYREQMRCRSSGRVPTRSC